MTTRNLMLSILVWCTAAFDLQREEDLPVAGLQRPTYIALLSSGELVVSNSGNNRLLVIKPTGGTIRELGGSVLSGNTGVAVLRTPVRGAAAVDDLLIAEQGKGRISRLRLEDGEVVGRVDDNHVRSPLDVLVTSRHVFVSDVCYTKAPTGECIGRVVLFSKSRFFNRRLEHVRTIDSSALPAGQNLHPHGLVAIPRSGGRLFVADSDSHKIWIFSFRGELLDSIGSRGTGPLQFIHPRGLLLLPAEQAGDGGDEGGGGGGGAGYYLVVAEHRRVQVLAVAQSSHDDVEAQQRLQQLQQGVVPRAEAETAATTTTEGGADVRRADHVANASSPAVGSVPQISSVQILDVEEDSNLLGLCAASDGRILVTDVRKDRVVVLRMRRSAQQQSAAGVVEEVRNLGDGAANDSSGDERAQQQSSRRIELRD